MLLRLSTILLIFYYTTSVYCTFNTENVKIWGPGLKADLITMPARYFFIETGMDYDSLKHSLPLFDIEIRGKNKFGINCRTWINVLDKKDGSFIVRYKLYDTCYNLEISILHKEKHIKESPYVFKNPVHPEDCECTRHSLKDWLEDFGCNETNQQIESDLKPFKNVNFTELRTVILSRYDRPNSYSLCNYVIIKNEIYRKCYGKYVQFNMFIDSILLSLARKFKLPDLELFTNLGDWPLSTHKNDPLPIFSWCGSDDTYDIVMPTYDLTESSLENMGRVMLDMLSVQGNINKQWNEKIPKIFWRGRDSNRRRLELIDIARQYPDLFNVSLINFFFYRNEVEKYGPKTDHVSFFSFFDYKYQLNIDGTVAAYRAPYLLAGDSVVFKQNSKYYEWFYKLLVPFYHYIPVKEDLSDLYEMLQWALQNDKKAHKIALQGQAFAKQNLLPQNVFCYYGLLLSKWSKLIVSDIKVLNGMEKVPHPKENPGCQCDLNIKEEL